jgi:succinyl-CoA synthetase alpha subunit
LLGPYDIAVSNSLSSDSTHFLGITVDRSARSPCIIASPTIDLSHISKRSHRFPFDYRTGPSQATVIAALEHLQLSAAPPAARDSAAALISTLWSLYKSQEALTVTVHIFISPTSSDLTVSSPSFTFDDAAFKSAKRHANLHELRAPLSLTETEAEAAGIVYIPLPSPSSNSDPKNLVGTLVNGAGLAMNTLDVLKIRLPRTAPANFLDTGGKATAATIATSFRLILADPRVAVVFVNIFGGLTLCDMIAEGVILAYKEVGVSKPVVVRLRGTNEEAGRKILEESGLPILPFDGFEEAVQEVGRLVENVN